ncbi:hypothetical protein TRVL_08415 [Trypanosoma vivax]|nr:hypothetical protein TRVL_08415 [Trypanosoma vivax]
MGALRPTRPVDLIASRLFSGNPKGIPPRASSQTALPPTGLSSANIPPGRRACYPGPALSPSLSATLFCRHEPPVGALLRPCLFLFWLKRAPPSRAGKAPLRMGGAMFWGRENIAYFRLKHNGHRGALPTLVPNANLHVIRKRPITGNCNKTGEAVGV